MPSSDLLVLLTVFTGTAAFILFVWRRGARGRRLVAAAWVAFFGFMLTATMAAHNLEILYHTIRGDMSFRGEPFVYDFHVYGLLLLGTILMWQGVKGLQAAAGLSRGEAAARRAALRAVLIVLALVVPLIPIHAFFGVLLTAISALSLPAIALTRRATMGHQPTPVVPDHRVMPEAAGV